MTLNMKTKNYIKTTVASLLIAGGASMTVLGTATVAQAADPAVAAVMADKALSGTFEKTSFKIKGSWQIVEENGQTIFRLSDDFKTKNGPDLKLFLSPKSVGDVTGKTAVNNAVKLSVLKSNKGTQDYVIPADVDLSQFKSILVHCEAYEKLWGGANL